tara:strand:- start:760 stop:1026 length:267 start_codon:yes stop_codon:yes gene_type:complete
MASFFDAQMRRFELLGSKTLPGEEKRIEDRPVEPSKEEKAEAQEKRRRQNIMEAFSKVGNAPPASSRAAVSTDSSDEDLLLSGLMGGY